MSFQRLTVSLSILVNLAAGTAMARYEHYGYLDSVTDERYIIVKEMILTPKPDDGPPLKEVIFDEKISDELSYQYEKRFGRTQGEQLIDPSNRFAVKEFSTGVQVDFEETQNRERSYGNFMAAKLAEHHLDRYLKSSPNARAVYELKERMSNLNVKTKSGYKFKVKYKISSNEVDFIVDNPYKIKNRVSYELGSRDTIYQLKCPITETVSIATNYRAKNDEYDLIGSKSLGPGLSASLTGQTRYNIEADKQKEDRVLIGFTWVH